MRENFELSNGNSLDESITNSVGINDLYYGQDASASTDSGKPTIDAETVKAATMVAGQLIGAVKGLRKPTDAETEKACGKRPLLGFTKKRKEWDKCSADLQQRLADAAAKSQEAELERQRLELEKAKIEASTRTPAPTETPDGDKFLGMPKAVGITVAVVGGLALIVGGIFLVRKLRK